MRVTATVFCVLLLAASGCDGELDEARNGPGTTGAQSQRAADAGGEASTGPGGAGGGDATVADGGAGDGGNEAGAAAGSGGAGGDGDDDHTGGGGALTDAITLTDAPALAARREALHQFLWGTTGLPATEAIPTPPTVNCQIPGLTDVGAVEELRVPMDSGEEGRTCHFVAAAPNRRLVVFNPGHSCTVVDGSDADSDDWTGRGDARSIQTLLTNGYGVLVSYMPHFRPDDCWPFGDTEPHVAMFERLQPTTGSVWKYFVEPIVDSLNYLVHSAPARGSPVYSSFGMVGLSGGGWTTVVSAAIDARIQVSVQVAGSEPLEFWNGYASQEEQTLPGLYQVAAYRDLYILGASGSGRRQVQVLNRLDDCCFFPGWLGADGDAWESSVRGYGTAIADRVGSLGDGGSFHLEIDDTAVTHEISRHAVSDIILPAMATMGTEP